MAAGYFLLIAATTAAFCLDVPKDNPAHNSPPLSARVPSAHTGHSAYCLTDSKGMRPQGLGVGRWFGGWRVGSGVGGLVRGLEGWFGGWRVGLGVGGLVWGWLFEFGY